MMAAVFTSTPISIVVGVLGLPFNFALVLPSFTNALCHQYTVEHLRVLSPYVPLKISYT